jgi:hypothetical protein
VKSHLTARDIQQPGIEPTPAIPARRTRCEFRHAFLALVVALLFAPLTGRSDTLPSRDPRIVLPLLLAFREHGSFGRIQQILGAPDADAISGFSITTFRLNDGTSVYVKATPSHNRIYTISRSAPGALVETLYEPLDRDLRHPLPDSAPF